MRELRKRIQVVLSYVLTVILIGAYPVVTFAETIPTTTVVSTDTTTTPVVADPAPAPAPAPKPVYTFDSTTNHWNTDRWKYNAISGQYEPVVTTGPTLLTGPTATPGPTALAPSASAPTSGGTTAATNPLGTTTTQVPSGTTGATNTVDLNGNLNAITNNTIGNTVGSTALTGNTAVSGNTTAGNATSGNASVSETIMNTINSFVASGASGVANFVSNISGDVNGDILLYPMILAAMLAQSALSPVTNTNTLSANTTVNAATNNQLTNNVNLDATSGTATVAGNTNAGNATSGSANAVANIMNMINSSVAANQSFIGTINIYGNLNGDILIAPDFMSQLLGSNNKSSTTVNQTLNANLANTDTISNNVNLSAVSGTATVAGNTNAGNATSGSAATNVVILNLTGHEVVASNSLLVFVNVLGRWVGLIVNAPAGATAAALGNGVNQNTVVNAAATISAQTNNQITNNITLASQSGNAAVTKNTNAGNATSGNATASANVLNMSQSSLDLSGWFGILFINVFGSWLGSFGIDTARGNPLPTDSATVGTPQQLQAVRFIAKPAAPASSSSWLSNPLTVSGTGGSTSGQPPAATTKPVMAGANVSSSTRATSDPQTGASITATGILGAVLILGATIRSLWPAITRRSGTLAS